MRKMKALLYFAAVVLAVVATVTAVKSIPVFISEMTTAVHAKIENNAKSDLSNGREDDGSSDVPYGAAEVSDLIVVNNENPFGDIPNDLVRVYDHKSGSYFVKDKNVFLSQRVMEPLNEMMDAFYKATGLKTVNVISGYRSVEYQKRLYQKIVSTNGSNYAKQYAQKPSFSEHHTGLAIDLGIFHKEDGSSEDFTGKGVYSWFFENSWKYGFIRRYDKNKSDITGIGYEPWHFRYVGKNNAETIFKNDLCLEEYVEKFVK